MRIDMRLVLLLGCLMAAAVPATAQDLGTSQTEATSPSAEPHPPPGRVGLGLQVGDPTGFSLKVYRRSSTRKGILGTVDAYTMLAAWNLDSFFYLDAHALKENGLEDSPLNYFIGPGVIVGVREWRDDTELVAGVSVEGGLNFFTEHFEVYLGLTPWFRFIPDLSLRIGGGVGLRFYP